MADILQRITSEFVEREDRLRIRGALADGQVVVLWFTQRLLNRALPPLIACLDVRKNRIVEATSADPLAGDPWVPVIERDGELHHVIDQIDLAIGDGGLHLTFSSEAGGVVGPVGALILNAAKLSQWLEILLRQYRVAQWPESAWGEWPTYSQISPDPHQSLTVCIDPTVLSRMRSCPHLHCRFHD